MDDQVLGNEVLKVVVVALMLGLEVTLYRVCVGGASTKAESSGYLRSHVVPYIFSKGHWFTWLHLSHMVVSAIDVALAFTKTFYRWVWGPYCFQVFTLNFEREGKGLDYSTFFYVLLTLSHCATVLYSFAAKVFKIKVSL